MIKTIASIDKREMAALLNELHGVENIDDFNVIPESDNPDGRHWSLLLTSALAHTIEKHPNLWNEAKCVKIIKDNESDLSLHIEYIREPNENVHNDLIKSIEGFFADVTFDKDLDHSFSVRNQDCLKARSCRIGKPRRSNCGKKWRIQWTDYYGKRISQTYENYDDAYNALIMFQTKRRVPFPFFVNHVYLPSIDKNSKHRTKDVTSHLNVHILPYFGKMLIDEIKTESVENFRSILIEKNLSVSTQRNILLTLSRILDIASEQGIIENYIKSCAPKQILSKSFSCLKSDDEILSFLYHSAEYGMKVYAFMATAIFTGMRLGELCGLKWKDIDFENSTIKITRSYKSEYKKHPLRNVPIFTELGNILLNWRENNDNPTVFPSEAGTMLCQQGNRIVTFKFPEILKKASLPKMCFKDLRHTFAFLYLSRGGDLYGLMKILGHTDFNLTMRYAPMAKSPTINNLLCNSTKG